MKSKTRLLAATLICAPALSAAAWYNEPTYVNPGTEGLSLGLTPLDYPATNSNKFLGQYVCVDANDQPIPADPYTCTSSRRKLRIGEDLPYIRYSKTASGKLAEVSNSIPLVFQNRVRFVNTRHSNRADRVLRNYRVGDGYDITDDYNGYAFIYGTRDAITTAEDFIWCGEFGKLASVATAIAAAVRAGTPTRCGRHRPGPVSPTARHSTTSKRCTSPAQALQAPNSLRSSTKTRCTVRSVGRPGGPRRNKTVRSAMAVPPCSSKVRRSTVCTATISPICNSKRRPTTRTTTL
jgi:hypothetical protein